MSDTDLNSLKLSLREFVDTRDWTQFHSSKYLAMALGAEAAEIIEHFQRFAEDQSKTLPQNKLDEVATELADTLLSSVDDFRVIGEFVAVIG